MAKDKTNEKNWNNIIEIVMSTSEEMRDIIKDFITNNFVSIDDKINNINFAKIYLQFLFFGDNQHDGTLKTNLDTIELWRQYFCRRDFQILSDYFGIPFDFENCTYENWVILKDKGFIETAYELVGKDAEEYYNYFNQIINLDTIINSYEIYGVIAETLKNFPAGKDIEKAIEIFKENKDWLTEIENFDIITK